MMEVFAKSDERRNLTIAIKDLDVVPSMSISSREMEQVFYHVIQRAADAPPIGATTFRVRLPIQRVH